MRSPRSRSRIDAITLVPGTRLCAVDDLADGAGIVVPLGRGWPIVEVVVLRRGDTFIGYRNQCAHMAVPLNLFDRVAMNAAGDLLLCDHHYATFRVTDGYCTEGPCMGESLTGVTLAIRDGAVFIA